jgi:hypothetical protein
MGRTRSLTAAALGTALALSGVAGAQSPVTQDSVHFTGGPSQARAFTVVAADVTSGPSGENAIGQVRFAIGVSLFGGRRHASR